MKRFLMLMAVCAVVDLLLPDAPDIGAQTMIAPAVLAAIIGAVGSVIGGALGGKPKGENQQLTQGTFGMPGGGAAEKFAMTGDRTKGPQAMGQIASRGGSGMADLFAQGAEQDFNDFMSTFDNSPMPNYNKKVLRNDEPIEVDLGIMPTGETPEYRPLTGSPPQRQAGAFDLGLGPGAGGTTSGKSGFTLGQVDMTGGGKSGGKFDADSALQMAAMAAQLGSILNAGGPPRPPSLSGGGRFDAAPTSMRFLYGG
jgi:hypothetical protein